MTWEFTDEFFTRTPRGVIASNVNTVNDQISRFNPNRGINISITPAFLEPKSAMALNRFLMACCLTNSENTTLLNQDQNLKEMKSYSVLHSRVAWSREFTIDTVWLFCIDLRSNVLCILVCFARFFEYAFECVLFTTTSSSISEVWCKYRISIRISTHLKFPIQSLTNMKSSTEQKNICVHSVNLYD